MFAGWSPTGSAFGHGADGLVVQGVRGPYLVSVFDARPAGIAGQAEFHLVLSRAAWSPSPGTLEAAAPITGARVEVTDASGQAHQADGIGSVDLFTLADRRQRLAITIGGPGQHFAGGGGARPAYCCVQRFLASHVTRGAGCPRGMRGARGLARRWCARSSGRAAEGASAARRRPSVVPATDVVGAGATRTGLRSACGCGCGAGTPELRDRVSRLRTDFP